MNLSVFDPGHGGRDPGAIGPRGGHEADFVLDIAKRANEYAAQQGHSIFMTRTTNKDFGPTEEEDLEARCNLANGTDMKYFVSFHDNSCDNPAVNGVEVYALTPGSAGENLARNILNELVPVMNITNRGVKFANFAVLRGTKQPAALIELGFISNADQELKLMDPGYRDQLAKAIVKGVMRTAILKFEEKAPAAAPAPAPAPAAPVQSVNADFISIQIFLNQAGLRDDSGNSLGVDGIPGRLTLQAAGKCIIKSGMAPDLKKKYKLIIKWLQQRLMDLGYKLPHYGADGDAGSETTAALLKFQKDRGLTPDGICGPNTWAQLLRR